VNGRRRLRRERLAGLVFVLLEAVAIGLWHPGERGTFWQGVEGRLLDARFLVRGPLTPPDSVAIVAFDNAAIARADTFPPPRAALAAAVSAAWEAGARAVALDFLLVDPHADDAALTAALRRGDAVLGVAEAAPGTPAPVLHGEGGFALYTGPVPTAALPALAPAPALQDGARLGHVTVRHGQDGALRRMRPALALAAHDGITHLPGLAIAAIAKDARLVMHGDGSGGRLDLGGISVPLDLRGTVPLNFHGPAGTIPTHSAGAVSRADLQGRIVFLGATATGFGDHHATPFDATLPGVEVHATLAANLLTGRALRRDAAAWLGTVALAVAAACAGFASAGLGAPLAATAATATAALAAASALQLAFVAGWWIDASSVLLALTLGALVGAGLRRVDQRRRARNLARYQSPALVDMLATLAEPLRHRRPQHAVVLFVDVAGFTTHAEHLGPRRTDAFLSLFHGLVERAADPHGGVIAHFAGDGALVVFGLPEPAADDAARALAFIDALFAAVRDSPDWPGLGLRVGGHAGPVQLGVLGGARHRHVSVSGDVVNAASRLQEFARSRNASLGLSDALVTSGPAATRWAGRAGLRKITAQVLRGRAHVEDVWVGDPARNDMASGEDGSPA